MTFEFLVILHLHQNQVGVIRKHYGKVFILKLLGDLLLTVGEDKMLYLWNLRYVYSLSVQ